MVMSKIHIICGNCGSTDISYEKDKNIEHDGEGHEIDCSSLNCGNCSTNHYLSELPKFRSS